MPRISFLTISLAAKCRLLFGLAVVIIVTAALFVPWLRMRDLVHENNIQHAVLMGKLAGARVDLGSGNWGLKQRALEQWWPKGAVEHGLIGPTPRLISIPDPLHPAAPGDADDYLIRAIEMLAQDRTLASAPATWREEGGLIVYRTVLPIRSRGGMVPVGTLLGVVSVEYPAMRANAALLINFGLCLMAGALAGILAVLVFYLITNRLILSPVLELTRVAESVSRGDHDVRAQIATGDEYEELSRAFNAMLTHLQSSENDLRRINKSLDTRLEQLAERNVELFEANKMKSQFLSNVSHELRTPLASIIGFAELLREAASDEGGRQFRYAENIMSSGRMLLGLINDLLDLAKIEAGKLELHVTAVNLKDMLENLVDFVRPLANKKSLQLSAVIPEEVPQIESDAGRIQQILYNLLSNAIKFTPEGGRVDMALESLDGDRVAIHVSDTGIGIPAEKLDTVFETFRQLDGSVTREYGGTGLGLAISRDLARLLGGTLNVTSESGKGSTFTVVLPIAPPEQTSVTLTRGINLT